MFFQEFNTLILSGCPGIGKSTWVEQRFSPRSLAMVVSADHYFERFGRYTFDPSKLKEAHAACLQDFMYNVRVLSGIHATVRGSPRTIIVDNTNTTALEIAPYYALSEAYGRRTAVVVFETGKECTVEEAAARCIHGVPPGKVDMMARRVRDMVLQAPPFWNLYDPHGRDLIRGEAPSVRRENPR